MLVTPFVSMAYPDLCTQYKIFKRPSFEILFLWVMTLWFHIYDTSNKNQGNICEICHVNFFHCRISLRGILMYIKDGYTWTQVKSSMCQMEKVRINYVLITRSGGVSMQQWRLMGLLYGRTAARIIIWLIRRAVYSNSFSTATQTVMFSA